ncbi:MAG: hypothetical protein IJI61_01405 [Oscillospiraceae bacterium]|nr:hypothetical protein [Oscillospiraceae bacterium]
MKQFSKKLAWILVLTQVFCLFSAVAGADYGVPTEVKVGSFTLLDEVYYMEQGGTLVEFSPYSAEEADHYIRFVSGQEPVVTMKNFSFTLWEESADPTYSALYVPMDVELNIIGSNSLVNNGAYLEAVGDGTAFQRTSNGINATWDRNIRLTGDGTLSVKTSTGEDVSGYAFLANRVSFESNTLTVEAEGATAAYSSAPLHNDDLKLNVEAGNDAWSKWEASSEDGASFTQYKYVITAVTQNGPTAEEIAAAEEAERQRLAEEEAERQRLAEEEAERQRLAEEEAERQRLAEEEAERQRLAEEEAERQRLAEEEAERQRLAEEEAERQRLAEEEAERQRLAEEEAERQRLAEEEAERQRLAEEEAERQRQQEEEAARQAELQRQQEEEAARQAELQRQQEEEAARQAELQRQQEEEAARQAELQRQQEEEAARQAELQRQQEEEARVAAEQAMAEETARLEAEAAAAAQQTAPTGMQVLLSNQPVEEGAYYIVSDGALVKVDSQPESGFISFSGNTVTMNNFHFTAAQASDSDCYAALYLSEDATLVITGENDLTNVGYYIASAEDGSPRYISNGISAPDCTLAVTGQGTLNVNGITAEGYSGYGISAGTVTVANGVTLNVQGREGQSLGEITYEPAPEPQNPEVVAPVTQNTENPEDEAAKKAAEEEAAKKAAEEEAAKKAAEEEAAKKAAEEEAAKKAAEEEAAKKAAEEEAAKKAAEEEAARIAAEEAAKKAAEEEAARIEAEKKAEEERLAEAARLAEAEEAKKAEEAAALKAAE